MAKDDASDRSPDVQIDADAGAARDRQRDEALANRDSLAQREREQRELVKAGKPTGITGEFGALEIGQSRDSAAQVALERNPQKQVSKVEYPDHTSKTFQYGADGQLSRTTDQNGWSWRKESGGWQLYNSNDERTETKLDGDIQVNQQGDFIFKANDGTTEISRADGTYRREYANGGSFERNAQNQVTSLTAADGTTKQFEYGPDGKLMVEKHQDGWAWRRDADGWHLYNNNNERTDTKDGDIQVTQQGDYISLSKDGPTEITRADGSYRREYANGSSFERSAQGQVTSQTAADGSTKQFEYGPDGKLMVEKHQDGSAWRREADGWHLYTSNGQRSPDRLKGDIQVDSQGNYIFRHDDGMLETTGADGKVSQTPARR